MQGSWRQRSGIPDKICTASSGYIFSIPGLSLPGGRALQCLSLYASAAASALLGDVIGGIRQMCWNPVSRTRPLEQGGFVLFIVVLVGVRAPLHQSWTQLLAVGHPEQVLAFGALAGVSAGCHAHLWHLYLHLFNCDAQVWTPCPAPLAGQRHFSEPAGSFPGEKWCSLSTWACNKHIPEQRKQWATRGMHCLPPVIRSVLNPGIMCSASRKTAN